MANLNDLFEKEFTLCCKDINWPIVKCERGFKTIEDLNIKARECVDTAKYRTTFFQGYKHTPNILRKIYIQTYTAPHVEIDKLPNTVHK